MTISKIIAQLKATASTNEKLSILTANKDNAVLRKVFELAYSPRINFWVKSPPIEWIGTRVIDMDILNAIETKVCGRKITGNEARAFINQVLAVLQPEEAVVLQNMINRDLDCGTGSTLANKVWPGAVPEFPVMLASKNTEKTQAKFLKLRKPGEAIVVQTKVDGGRFIYVAGEGGYSRAGNLLNVHNVFAGIDCYIPGYVLDGELVCVDAAGNLADRKTSNGIYNKAVRGTISKEEAQTLRYIVWDVIPRDIYFGEQDSIYKNTPMTLRLEKLRNLLGWPDARDAARNIELVESCEVDSLDEAQQFYARAIADGQEGAMVKLAGSLWEDARSASVIKMKAEEDATLYCIGTTPHNKKEGQIGSLLLQSSCGSLQVSVGSGLDDALRQQAPDFFIGKLVQIKYNAVIQAKKSETASLFLPIFCHIRHDVTEADTLLKLK